MNEKGDDRIHILIVEDDQVRAESLQKDIKEKLGENVVIVIEADHEKAAPILLRPHPYDVVILDRFRGNLGNGDDAGQMLWQEILNVKFVPVLIHTAGGCDLEPPFPKDNPILRCFLKTSDSDVKIAEHLVSIRKHLDELREVQKEINAAFKSVLLVTSTTIWKEETNEEQRAQLLLRSARRRLAATMDSATEVGQEKLLFWEQYIYPPLEESLLMRDLLYDTTAPANKPTSFSLVLTPSCDLVSCERPPKVNQVLVARCCSSKNFLAAALSSSGIKKVKKKWDDEEKPEIRKVLQGCLTRPESGGYVFLPEFKTIFPAMAACLREIELISWNEISLASTDNKRYNRVVSIDSPFREQIAWAYLQIAARPGLPDRDLDRCIDDNFETLRLSKQS